MGYLAICFSHKNTEIFLREKLTFNSDGTIKDFLVAIKSSVTETSEIILLSTCNRLEIYLYTQNNPEITASIINKLALAKNLENQTLQNIADVFVDQGAVHHLFCVASGLDSLVIGETQIVGQLKRAYKVCFDWGFCGKNLTRLIHFGFKCGAYVRNSTQISQNAISIASVAVKEANRLFQEYGSTNRTVLVVGAGEMGRLTIKHLLSYDYQILLLNRNLQNAYNLADELNAQYNKIESKMIQVRSFSELPDLLNQCDLLFSATSASCAIIEPSMVKKVDFKRFWFDLAVPRDIQDPKSENIVVFAVDDLQQVVSQNFAHRRRDMTKAYEIVGTYTMDFFKWLQSLGVDPLIKEIRRLAKTASLKELERAIKKGFIPKQYEESVAKILHGAFNSFLHKPTLNIKSLGDDEESDPLIEAVKVVFDLHNENILVNRYKCEYDTTPNQRI